MKHFTITRDKAAEILKISTRTIDRYIKSGKLSYNKVANKVFLAVEEVEALKKEFAVLHQEVSTELVSERVDSQNNVVNDVNMITASTGVKPSIDLSVIEDKLDKFSLIFVEKDKMIEEKNKLIRLMQARISELETKIQSMIALPDYTKEKQEAIEEKKLLEEKITMLKERLKEQETKTYVILGLSVLFIAITVFLVKVIG